MAAKRDLRIDFFRGLALFIILYDHILYFSGIDIPFFLKITPAFWGESSAFAIFVFLSAYVYGLVFGRCMDRDGPAEVCRRSCRRAVQLYLSNLITLAVCAALIAIVFAAVSDITTTYWSGQIVSFAKERMQDAITMQCFPAIFNILPVYIVLLIIAPAMMILLHRHVWAGLAVAFVLYELAQLGCSPGAALFSSRWHFDPFAWQLLFVIGIVQGWKPRIATSRIPAWCAGIIVAAFAARLWVLPRIAEALPFVPDALLAPLPLTGKETIAPVRLLHFCCLAYCCAFISRGWSRSFQQGRGIWRAGTWLFVFPGQQSLNVFLFGAVYTYIAIAVIEHVSAGWPAILVLIAAGWGLSVGVAVMPRIAVRKRIRLDGPSV